MMDMLTRIELVPRGKMLENETPRKPLGEPSRQGHKLLASHGSHIRQPLATARRLTRRLFWVEESPFVTHPFDQWGIQETPESFDV